MIYGSTRAHEVIAAASLEKKGGLSESVARHSESLDLWDLKQNSEQNLEQNLERSKTKVFAQG